MPVHVHRRARRRRRRLARRRRRSAGIFERRRARATRHAPEETPAKRRGRRTSGRRRGGSCSCASARREPRALVRLRLRRARQQRTIWRVRPLVTTRRTRGYGRLGRRRRRRRLLAESGRTISRGAAAAARSRLEVARVGLDLLRSGQHLHVAQRRPSDTVFDYMLSGDPAATC